MRLLGAVMLVGVGIVAAGAIVAAPYVIRIAKPGLREGMKRGAAALERARGALAEMAEDVEDWVAETRTQSGARR